MEFINYDRGLRHLHQTRAEKGFMFTQHKQNPQFTVNFVSLWDEHGGPA